ncbi:hypothetical protein O9992_23600 [Vibrio lentus]|nr:hypothetical protein [Vibrio lentus]
MDRNYAFGHAQPDTIAAYDAVYQSTEAGLDGRAGRTTGDVWQAMWSVLEKNGARQRCGPRRVTAYAVNRVAITCAKWGCDTKTRYGVNALPGMQTAKNRMMVHEENIVITESGCEMLHQRAWQSMPIIKLANYCF